MQSGCFHPHSSVITTPLLVQSYVASADVPSGCCCRSAAVATLSCMHEHRVRLSCTWLLCCAVLACDNGMQSAVVVSMIWAIVCSSCMYVRLIVVTQSLAGFSCKNESIASPLRRLCDGLYSVHYISSAMSSAHRVCLSLCVSPSI